MAFAQGSLHVAQALTDLAVAFEPSSEGYLRDKFFPRRNVQHLTDKIRKISKANSLLLQDLAVGNDGRVPEVQYRLDTDLTYTVKGYGAEVVIDDIDAGNADAALIHEERQMKEALLKVTLALEYQAVNLTLRDNAILTNSTTLAAAKRWDNYGSTTSDPIADMLAACTQIRHKTGGKNVNRLAMGEFTFNAIQQHPNVIKRVQLNAGAGAILTPAILCDILRIEPASLVITANTYNSANQGATAAYKSFLGSDVVLAYVGDGGLYDYSLGHEFAWSGYGSEPVVVVKYRDEKRGLLGSNIIRVGSMVDFKVTQTDAAYLYKTVLDTSATAYGSLID